MSRKLMIGFVIAVIALILLVPTVIARERDATLEALYGQIYELRRQIVERRVDLGDLTAEEGERILTLMEERYMESLEEGTGRFYGMPGRGWSNGWGGGFGHCWRY